MEIRKYLNENPMVAYGLTGGLVLVAILFIVWYVMSGSTPPPNSAKPDLSKGFYSDDDGNSFFVDAIGKTTPFDHGGKKAVRAYVFRCGSKTFIGLLGQETELGRSQPDAKTIGGDYGAIMVATGKPPKFEIKKPGSGSKWISVTTGVNDPWRNMLALECPGGGSDIPVPIAPGQQ